MLYTETHFHFPMVIDIPRFCKSILPCRLEAIRSFSVYSRRISGLPNTPFPFEVLENMPGLRALRIDLRQIWLPSLGDESLLRFVDSVRCVRAARVASLKDLAILELVLDGDEDEVWERWRGRCEEAGVTLVREEFTGVGARTGTLTSNIDFVSVRFSHW